MCKCFRIAELSRNILVQPLCGQAIVRGTSSPLFRLGLILEDKNDLGLLEYIIEAVLHDLRVGSDQPGHQKDILITLFKDLAGIVDAMLLSY